jgi:hypothetical protein
MLIQEQRIALPAPNSLQAEPHMPKVSWLSLKWRGDVFR